VLKYFLLLQNYFVRNSRWEHSVGKCNFEADAKRFGSREKLEGLVSEYAML